MDKIFKVLIVDDVSAAHLLYRQALKKEEYEIFDAERGKEALSLVLRNDFDLIILDLNLPDLNGLEVLKKMRSKGKTVPVIILTAYGMKESVVKAAGLGINYYLVKPVDLNMLRKRVKQVLGEDKPSDLEKFSETSSMLLEKLAELENDDILDESVKELKQQIKDIAGKLKVIEKTKVSKGKMEEAVWEKETTCPICASSFNTYNYRSKSFVLVKRESDFHEVYDMIDPLVFDMWVCPECLYSAKREDFNSVDIARLEILAKDKIKRKKVAGRIDFRQMRTIDTGIMSYRLAIMSYDKSKETKAFIGSLYLKAAWLAREKMDENEEKEFLIMTSKYYEEALLTSEKIGGQLTELGFIYLLGEVHRRLGDDSKANKYFMRVKRDDNIQNEKAILRLAEEQMEKIKEDRKRKKNENSKKGS